MKKRIMSLALVLCMLLSMTVTVSFATGEGSGSVTQACTCTSHAEDDGSDWKPLKKSIDNFLAERKETNSAAAALILTSGNYYAEDDITFTSYIYVIGDVNICLNGKTVTLEVNSTNMGLFNLALTYANSAKTDTYSDPNVNSSSLTICDHDPSNAGTITDAGTGTYYPNAVRTSTGSSTITLQAGNLSGFRGAAISTANGGTVNIEGGTISGNGTKGGDNSANNKTNCGIWMGSGTVNVKGGTISGHTATSGGGIYVTKGTLNITGGTISGNTATNGGGIYAKAGAVNVSGGCISGNTAAKSGGGLYLGGGTHTISGGVIENNEATGDQTATDSGRSGQGGGGVYVINKNTVLTMSGGEITNNTANRGGAVYAYYWGIFNMSDGTISGNSVTSGTHAAAVYMSATRNVCTLSGGNIVDNNCSGVAAAGKTSVSLAGVNVTGNAGTNQVQIAALTDNDTTSDSPAGLEHFIYVSDGVIGSIGYTYGSDMAISGGSFGAALPSLASLADGYSLYHDATEEYPYWAAADAECEHTETEGIVTAVPATCTENGVTAGEKCSACKTVITLSGVDKAGHDYGDLIPAVEAVHNTTTLTAGVAAHYQCSACEKYFTEAKVEVEYADLVGETPVHEYTNANGYKDEDGHADTCTCGAIGEVADHTPNVDAATEETAKYCTVCNYVIEARLSHVHSLTHVPAAEATCTETGNIEYWSCTCDKYFSDAEATNEITDKDSVVVAALNHPADEREVIPAVAPTESAVGYTAGEKCGLCDHVTVAQDIIPVIVAGQMVDVEVYKQNNIAPAPTGHVFAGWYADADCTIPYTGDTGEAYAKYVDEDVLKVMYQITAGTTIESADADLRLVSTVDDLNYREVGFKLTVNGKTVKVSSSTVYSAIAANDGGVVFTEDPSIFCEDSEYFITYTITDIKKANFGTDILVVPFWITMDGTEYDGVANTVSVMRALNS